MDNLISLGYRQLECNIWAKPVGLHLFTYNFVTKEWINFFTGEDGQTLIYEIKKLESSEDTLVTDILYKEAYTRIDMGKGNFNFFTLEDYLNL